MESCKRVLWLCVWLTLAGPVIAEPEVQRVCKPHAENCITDSEKWAKTEISQGRSADLSVFCDSPAALNTQNCGRLRPGFVRDLIASTATNDRAAPNGITLRNAMICEWKPKNRATDAPTIEDPDICDETFPFTKQPLHRNSFVEDVRQVVHTHAYPLDLRDLRSKVAIDLLGNHLLCDLQLGGAYLEQVLNLDETVIDGGVDAHQLRVDGSITMYGATIHGDVEADGVRSAGSITLYHSQVFGTLHMRGAIIGGDLDLGGLIVVGPWPVSDPYSTNMDRSSVGTPRSGVDLSNTHVARQLYMSGAAVRTSDVDLSGVIVDGSIWMEQGTQIPWALTMERAFIGDSLLLGGSTFNQVDLSGARIGRDLRLENDGNPTLWGGGRFKRCLSGPSIKLDETTWLGLRGAKIGAIRDMPKAWPDCVMMSGLVYERAPHDNPEGHENSKDLSPYRWCRLTTNTEPAVCPEMKQPYEPAAHYEKSEPARSFWYWHDWTLPSWPFPFWPVTPEPTSEAAQTRSIVWWRNWLERDPEQSSESYTQLSTTLANVGLGDGADAVRFEQRIFERDGHGVGFVIACLEEVLIGFGIGTYALIALFWAVLLTTLATWRLRRRMVRLHLGATQDKGIWWCWFASVQTLLPLITLSKQMDDFLHNPANPHDPSTQPLLGWLAVGFSALAFAGLLLSGFLLNGLRSYAGL
jgi:hypothetical protein